MTGSPLSDWHRAHGATMIARDGGEVPLSYAGTEAEVSAALTGAGLIDLAAVPTFTLSGEQVQRWCNGMFTNNIRRLQPGQGNRSAMCDDRGRVLGVLDLYCVDAHTFLIALDGTDLEAFTRRYQMFMVLDDIELDAPGPWLLSLQGPAAADVLAAAGLPVPREDHEHVVADGVRVARKTRTGPGGFDLFVDDPVAVWSALLDAGATPLGHRALDTLRVLAGRARWPEDGTDKSMVHELALNEECCAFDKGCYVGQEIINRIDVKGTIQKRLTKVAIDGPMPPVGAAVVQDGRKVGTLTSLAAEGGRTIGLGVLRKSAWEAGTALVIEVDGERIPAATVPLG